MIAIVPIAIANRQSVSFSINPFEQGEESSWSLSAPLFVWMMLAMIMGAAFGALVMWLQNHRLRKNLKMKQRELDRVRADLEQEKTKNTSAAKHEHGLLAIGHEQ